mmetsp:Transcript_1611/g.4241  ORF Transcript_1611/g.4241 Transcript_1611/m.4241 type:complete len:527 (+) Transcript_1611:110-1690(+)
MPEIQGLLLCFLAALRSPETDAFVFSRQRSRWTMPPETSSEAGLGRGITFSIDPDVCEVLQPRFLEYFQGWSSLASCEDIDDTIGRALASWSGNAQSLSFFNVSHACSPGICVNSSELHISARRGSVPNAPSTVATTRLELAQEPPRSTTGQYVYTDATIVSAHIELLANDDMCWYMDGNTCSNLLNSDFDVEALVVGWYLVFLTTGILIFGFTVYRLSKKLSHSKAYKDKRKTLNIVLAESDSVVRINLMVFFLTFPNIFYLSFFQPCFTCFSFEAAVLHNVGLALGLDDISVHAARNLKSTALVGGDTCLEADRLPTEAGAIVAESPFYEDPEPAPGRLCDYSKWWECENRLFSAMLTPDPLHAKTCPTEDDLAGLSVLYPSCSGQVFEPMCVPTARNSAWWRFTLLFGIPSILVLVLLPISTWFCRKCIRWWDEGPSETERAVLATLASVISREEHGAYRNAVEGESDAAAGDAPNGEAATGADAAPRKLPTISFKGFKEQFSRAARNISFKLSVALDRRRGA